MRLRQAIRRLCSSWPRVPCHAWTGVPVGGIATPETADSADPVFQTGSKGGSRIRALTEGDWVERYEVRRAR
jgi:hypothetical protein